MSTYEKQRNNQIVKMSCVHGSAAILEHGKNIKLRQKTIPYERYGEILFQKVASCYLLHFVQDGSSKNAQENSFFCKKCQKSNIGKQIRIYSPPNSRSTAPLRRLFMLVWIRTLSVRGSREWRSNHRTLAIANKDSMHRNSKCLGSFDLIRDRSISAAGMPVGQK